MRASAFVLVAAATLLVAPQAGAEEPTPGYHPWASPHFTPKVVDLSAEAIQANREAYLGKPVQRGDWADLDRYEAPAEPPPAADIDPALRGRTPDGWVQKGSVVLPEPIANGELQVDPQAIFAVEDIPGNEYPRKHTLYLNFVGGMLYSGTDNSAEDKSQLAKQGVYPTYSGGSQQAVSIAQAVADDVSDFGIRVVYLPEDRPDKVVPYTMQMMGGQWSDTNIDDPAGGVAPGADCGALGQRHVVYTFGAGGVNSSANTASQEAGHAWGLDHTFNCSSVMSYCGVANGSYSNECDTVCEVQCQGPNSIGCTMVHDMFCGEGSEQQNDSAELDWIFGSNEPDMEPPFAMVVEPEEGEVFESGADVDVRAMIGDDYGGYGWSWTVLQNGEEVFNEVDYDRQVDAEFRPTIKFSNLDDGEWEVIITVADQYDHVTESAVAFVVGDGVPSDDDDDDDSVDETGDDDDDDDDDGDDGDDDDDDDEDGGSEGGDATAGGTADDGGCAVSSDGRGPAGWMVLGLFALIPTLRRRRR